MPRWIWVGKQIRPASKLQGEHDVQAASDSPISKAFDKLKDEKAVSQAVRQGVQSS